MFCTKGFRYFKAVSRLSSLSRCVQLFVYILVILHLACLRRDFEILVVLLSSQAIVSFNEKVCSEVFMTLSFTIKSFLLESTLFLFSVTVFFFQDLDSCHDSSLVVSV